MAGSKRSPRAGRKSRSDPDGSSGFEAESPALLPFEGALDQLEGTVSRLEEGEMPLEEALELFEAGIKLSRQCNATLEAAERRIEILMADRGDASGAWKAGAFDAGLAGADGDDEDADLEEDDPDPDEEDFED